MMTHTMYLSHSQFSKTNSMIFKNSQFEITTFTYPSGVEALTLKNSKGHLTVLPYMGLIIWDAIFDDISLKMTDMFSQPLPGDNIADTYGCFQFNSGLLANGTPGPEDDYNLHGEFPTAKMDRAYLQITDETVTIVSECEYVKGFGHHYLAKPSVTLHQSSGLFDINMAVTNLSKYQPMPLQYMCHMNYAYVEQGTITQNFPDELFKLRESVPGHVHPTDEWLAYNDELKASGKLINYLDDSKRYDPEIVFFTEDLTKHIEDVEFKMSVGQREFITQFKSAEFPIVTRWLLFNPDQQVAAFALPATSRPEGFTAAQKAGTLIYLEPNETQTFTVKTGLKD